MSLTPDVGLATTSRGFPVVFGEGSAPSQRDVERSAGKGKYLSATSCPAPPDPLSKKFGSPIYAERTRQHVLIMPRAPRHGLIVSRVPSPHTYTP